MHGKLNERWYNPRRIWMRMRIKKAPFMRMFRINQPLLTFRVTRIILTNANAILGRQRVQITLGLKIGFRGNLILLTPIVLERNCNATKFAPDYSTCNVISYVHRGRPSTV